MTRTALTFALTLTMVALPLSAATISVGDDGTLRDGDSTSGTTTDGSGDSVGAFNNLVVGPRDDGDTSNSIYSQEFRAGLRFDISGNSSDITNAASIFLDVTTSASDDSFESGSPAFDIELYGLDSAGVGLVAGDFEASATLLGTIARSSIAADTLYSPDVTDFVQEAEVAGSPFVEFRLQAADFTGTPDTGTGLFVTRFDSDEADGGDTSDAPQLRTIPIPEPAGAMLIGVGGLILLGRRRASDRR